MPDKTANGKEKSLKDFLLSPQLKSEGMEIDIAGQVRKVVVKEPTLRIREEYLNRLDMDILDEDRVAIKGSVSAAQVWLVIGCLYDPKKDERIFAAKDEKALMSLPASSFVSEVAGKAQAFMNEAKEEAKNSEAMQKDS